MSAKIDGVCRDLPSMKKTALHAPGGEITTKAMKKDEGMGRTSKLAAAVVKGDAIAGSKVIGHEIILAVSSC